MAQEDLQKMADAAQAAEAAEDKAEHDAEIEALTTPEEETAAVDTQGLKIVACTGVAAVGGISCRMANVTPLAGEEVDALADCLVQLAEVYDIGNMHPKTAAWFNLGTVAVAVIAGRQKLPPPEPDNDDEAGDQEAKADADQLVETKGYGDGEKPSAPPKGRAKAKPKPKKGAGRGKASKAG